MKKGDEPLNSDELEQAYKVAHLIAGHIRKTLTSFERKELDSWLEASEKNIQLFEELTDERNIQRALDWYNHLQKEEALKTIKEKIPFVPERKKRSILFSVSVAAAVIFFIAVGILFWNKQKNRPNSKENIAQQNPSTDVQPGGNRAVLTLSDGRQIILDSRKNGNLLKEGNTQLVKSDSSLSYSKTEAKLQPVINTISVPKGGQYQITLSDGTKVWLNASSSLRFPTAFTEKERMVELTGEGYFEITHNAAHPFKVKVGDIEVQDIGTAFNINSYGDEVENKTTLIEGSLKITKGTNEKVLYPGEQAEVTNKNITVQKVNARAVIAWKNGAFDFKNTLFPTVMKELERWYNIEIENKDQNKTHLNATIKRNVPLSKMLMLLEGQGGVHFKWKGKKLLIVP